jgi:hypothetical protein
MLVFRDSPGALSVPMRSFGPYPGRAFACAPMPGVQIMRHKKEICVK